MSEDNKLEDPKTLMFQEYLEGKTLKEISENHGVSYRTIQRYAKDGDWSAKREIEMVEMTTAVSKGRTVLAEEAVDKAIRVLHKIASDTEVALYNDNPDGVKANVKVLVDSIDKLVRLKMFMETGGVAKSEVHVKKETLDWNQLIEQSIKAKREHGNNFDEQEFLKQALNKGDKS